MNPIEILQKLWELNTRREPLVMARNKLVDKPFFLWRFWLRKPLALIDTELDIIDKEIMELRTKLGVRRLYGRKRKESIWNLNR